MTARGLLKTAAVLVVLALVAVVVWVVIDGRRPPPSADQATPGPVLLVPGYGGGEDALGTLATRLRTDGREVSIVSSVGDGTGDLNDQARALDQAVRSALAGGAPSVDLVGFSAGGVVVRLWLVEYKAAESVRRVVTLGSPHHGTQLAAGVAALVPSECPTACRQLVPGSDLLDRLNGRDETPAGPQWTSIWTSNDQTVTPPDSARLEGARNLVVQDACPGVGAVAHGDLPRNAAVGALVRAALGRGLIDPVSANCGR